MTIYGNQNKTPQNVHHHNDEAGDYIEKKPKDQSLIGIFQVLVNI